VSEERRKGSTSLGRLMPQLRSGLGGKPSPILSLIGIWPEIVGAELARQSRPEKLSVPRAGKAGGSLQLRCTGAAALELQHRAPEIMERINAFMGFAAVGKIVLNQGPLPQARSPHARLATPLDNATRNSMLQATQHVSAPELRAALERLAKAIARDPGPAKPKS
jgi:hypothetical protein